MDRSMNKLIYAALLPLIFGCGGDAPLPSSPATDTDAPIGLEDATARHPLPAEEEKQANPPTKGMTFPDDLPRPNETQPTKANDDKPKGMVLPDNLKPSASHSMSSEHIAMLVGTQSTQTDSEETRTDIRLMTWAEIDAAIKKSGRVTVVDFWSLGCVPCLKEFPNLVALQKKYPDQVRAIGVNVDFYGGEKYPAKSYQSRVTSFLQATHATFPNYISKTPSDDVFESVKINALPAVLVLDETGKIVGRFTDASQSGGFTYEKNIFPVVEKLLAK